MAISTLKPLHRFIVITAAVVFILGAFSLLQFRDAKTLSLRPSDRYSSEETLSKDVDTTLQDIEKSAAKPWWFIGTVTPAHSIQRRAIIRATWQKMYRDDSIFTMRFVVSNPTDLWRRVLKHENDTFGDIIELSHLEEVAKVANSVKTMHMFKYLEQQGRPYEWVTKIDDDSFLDVPAFLRDYLLPRMDMDVEPPVATVNRTIIARKLFMGPVMFPGGQFYTMTWDTLQKVSELFNDNPFDTLGEDELNGRLLHDANEHWDIVELPNPIAFDYNDAKARGDGTAWVDEDNEGQLREWIHAVGPGAVNPHKMKEDDSYLRVSQCFDENGLMERPPMKKQPKDDE